ncbi:MAG TPA: hypothetical protein VLG28_01560 [Acidimicrobiia bacterium]|jgi:hypothetical protein|nr:hypothetical protein [Acidimicrobiia bacterium]
MSQPPITVEPALVRCGAKAIAVIRCAASLDAAALSDAVAGLQGDADSVALLEPGEPGTTVASLAIHPTPVATAAPITDALKRVAADRITGTVDRTSVARAGLPMLLSVDSLMARLATLGQAAVPAGALLDPRDRVALVDRSELTDPG